MDASPVSFQSVSLEYPFNGSSALNDIMDYDILKMIPDKASWLTTESKQLKDSGSITGISKRHHFCAIPCTSSMPMQYFIFSGSRQQPAGDGAH